MPPSHDKSGFNVNTLLISILLMLSSWTLVKVSSQGELVAAMSIRIQNLERIVYAQKTNG